MALHSTYDGENRQTPKSETLRSHGPILSADAAAEHSVGSQLLFDPLQNGWLHQDVVNDFCDNHRRTGWPKTKSPVTDNAAIFLRSWTDPDAQQFRALLDNPEVWRYMPNPYPGPISTEMARDLIALSSDTKLHIVRAIVSEETPVGQVRLEFGDKDPELSFWLGQSYWGKGLVSRAVSKFVKACFEEHPGIDRMMARVRSDNRASLRVLEKAGFVPEARSNVSPNWIMLHCERS